MTESQIANIGIGRKFQRPTVFETLSVLREHGTGAEDGEGAATPASARRLDSEQLDRIEQTLVQVNLRDAVWRTAGILSHGQKQWLEIGMLLVQQPRLILLDEPVAGMTDAETDRTAELCLSLEGLAFAGGGGARHGVRRARSPARSPCCTRARCWPKGRWTGCAATRR